MQFTTLQSIGLDSSVLANFCSGLCLSGTILGQILYFGDRNSDSKKQ